MANYPEKQVMVVGFDDKEHSIYALEWTLNHFFTPFASTPLFRLVIVTAKPPPPPASVLAGGSVDVLPYLEEDMKKMTALVAEKAKEICSKKMVYDAVVEVMQGDPRNVLCEAAERHQAAMLVVGSHGYGAIKRAVLGSVSDYCTHNARCTVMIVKRSKIKN